MKAMMASLPEKTIMEAIKMLHKEKIHCFQKNKINEDLYEKNGRNEHISKIIKIDQTVDGQNINQKAINKFDKLQLQRLLIILKKIFFVSNLKN